MGTFKAYWKKEILESWRQYRYIVLAAGFIVFSILDPLMLKLLPMILQSQVPAEMADFLMTQMGPEMAVTNYLQDMVQLAPLFIILGLMGSLADEIRLQKLVLPYTKGTEAGGMVLAKFLHYAGFVALSCAAGFALNWYYVGILFPGGSVTIGQMMTAAALYAVFYAFAIALLLLLSSLFKRGIAAALVVLFFSYFAGVLANSESLAVWVPNTLLRQAALLGNIDVGLTTWALLTSVLYIAGLVGLTVWRMRRVEVV